MKASSKPRFVLNFLVMAASLLVFELPAPLAAQQTQGKIALEDTSTKRRGYRDVEQDTIEYFEKFSKQLKSIGKTKVNPLKPLDHDEVNYLAASYLYCALKKGVCTSLLDSILELDAYNSALNGSTT